MSGIGSRFTYANVVATLALFLALTGGAVWAAKKIGSKNIKRGAVEKKHIAKDAVRKKHIKDSQVDGSKIEDGAVGRDDLAGGSVGPAQIGANAVGASAVAPNSLGGAQIDESSLQGVDAATVNGVAECRQRATVVADGGGVANFDNPVCSVGGFDLTLSCETDASALTTTGFVELSPPANGTAIAIDGDVDAFNDRSANDASVAASETYELARTNAFHDSAHTRLSPPRTVVATSPTGALMTARMVLITEVDPGNSGACTVAVAMSA